MNVSHAAARVYAKALFDIGLEEGSIGTIHDDLHAVFAALSGLDDDLSTFFNMPHLRRDEKRRILNLAFEGKLSRPVLGLLLLLVEKRREPLLNNVVEEFDQYRGRHEGRVEATVTTARKLDAALAKTLRKALEEKTKKIVVIHENIDPEALGGIRITLGDSVLDGTIRRGVQDMRRRLAASQG